MYVCMLHLIFRRVRDLDDCLTRSKVTSEVRMQYCNYQECHLFIRVLIKHNTIIYIFLRVKYTAH